jgi:hypothetical protein
MSKEELPSSQHDQLATAIVRGKSNAGWARQIGVPGRTAQRWATEPMSAARLRAADQRIRQIERIDPSAGAAKRTKPRSASRCAFQFRRRVGELSHRKRFGRLCRRCGIFRVPAAREPVRPVHFDTCAHGAHDAHGDHGHPGAGRAETQSLSASRSYSEAAQSL